jgi:uncharacterized protein (TIGR02246 family)
MSADDALMRDEWAMRRLAMTYAKGADRNDPTAFASVFTEDGIIEGPGFQIKGRDAIATNPGILRQMFASTFHTVLNQTVDIDGDAAEGETYCLAYHLNHPKDGVYTRLDWAIRYQDKFRRVDGRWLFSHRKLVIDWTETSEVQLMPQG